ncbi:MAG: class I SAM-dependent methyltransferase [Planctomycetales bacterium]
MSETDRERWNAKYADKQVASVVQPNRWLVENLASLPRGAALDLACGLGHNAAWLALQGFQAEGWDVSTVGLRLAEQLAEANQAEVSWRECDLETVAWPRETFDVIVCSSYYLPPSSRNGIVAALKSGGMLVYETFTRDHVQQPGSHCRNPAYMLEPNEPLRWFDGLRIRRYRDAVIGGKAVASLLAEKT